MNEYSTAEWILSFIITWTIGLLPPLLIRFVFLKRPIGKNPAIGICGLFLFLNILLFTVLGSESKTHAVQLLIAYISYWILRKEKKASPTPATVTETVTNEQVQEEQLKNEPILPAKSSFATLGKISAFIVLLVVMAFAGEIGKMVGKSTVNKYETGKKDSTINSILLETSKELNAQLPMMVDEETRLDVTMVMGKQLNYKYTLVNLKVEDIDKKLFRSNLV
ncbi:MAG: hypothetical protein HY756_03875 [Nitrospirae bacterium]|nr:hypothetical protein [Nitrospirota bacterium]